MGESLAVRNGHRDVPGPYFSFLIAGCVTARVRLAMATTIAHLKEHGGSWLHAATDSLLIAATHESKAKFVRCPGGPVRRGRLRGLLALPIPEIGEGILAGMSGVPWKHEAGFDEPMVGYVSRVNRFAMLNSAGGGRATESALGGIYADPTGTNQCTSEGQFAWAVGAHLAVARAGLAWDGKGPVPELDLAEWGENMASRVGTATDWDQVQRLQAISRNDLSARYSVSASRSRSSPLRRHGACLARRWPCTQ